MTKQLTPSAAAAFGVLAVLLLLPAHQAHAQLVFQAAGPTAASIQGTVDAFRAALGEPNNASNPGPLPSGRREINWDGGGSTNTTEPANPFLGFFNSRGARFTTPGEGLSQGPPEGGAQGGLAVLFDNPTYGAAFSTFSAPRLFTPVGSRFTDALFFVPGTQVGDTDEATPATVTGFGAVFSDVDKPNGGRATAHSTRIEYFDINNRRIFTGLVPAAPGEGGLAFFGVVFEDARIFRVRITTGDSRPGPDDDRKDIVMMDDFFYGEPQTLP
jgi:hypothetical protein